MKQIQASKQWSYNTNPFIGVAINRQYKTVKT